MKKNSTNDYNYNNIKENIFKLEGYFITEREEGRQQQLT